MFTVNIGCTQGPLNFWYHQKYFGIITYIRTVPTEFESWDMQSVLHGIGVFLWFLAINILFTIFKNYTDTANPQRQPFALYTMSTLSSKTEILFFLFCVSYSLFVCTKDEVNKIKQNVIIVYVWSNYKTTAQDVVNDK